MVPEVPSYQVGGRPGKRHWNTSLVTLMRDTEQWGGGPARSLFLCNLGQTAGLSVPFPSFLFTEKAPSAAVLGREHASECPGGLVRTDGWVLVPTRSEPLDLGGAWGRAFPTRSGAPEAAGHTCENHCLPRRPQRAAVWATAIRRDTASRNQRGCDVAFTYLSPIASAC